MTICKSQSNTSGIMNHSIEHEPNTIQVYSNKTRVSEAILLVEDVGNLVRRANTKLITWRFVDSSMNPQEENPVPHTVCLRWNKRSGEMRITMDGELVCNHTHKAQDIISHKWRTPDGTQMIILAARVTPNGVSENFQKYGLIVNGKEVPLMTSSEDCDEVRSLETSSGRKICSVVQMLYPNGYDIDSKTEELLYGGMAMETERMLMV